VTADEALAEKLRIHGDEPIPLFPTTGPPQPVDLDEATQ
jgi:hypothetical protein